MDEGLLVILRMIIFLMTRMRIWLRRRFKIAESRAVGDFRRNNSNRGRGFRGRGYRGGFNGGNSGHGSRGGFRGFNRDVEERQHDRSLDNLIIYLHFSSEVSTVHKFVYTDEALLLIRQ